jgi:predicted O-methyltransferase YrrM
MHSLDLGFVTDVLSKTIPSFQLTSQENQNLGFGYMFYGLTRTLRPKKVVVIGSKAGFAPICFAKGLLDNAGSHVARIDAEEVSLRESTRPGILDFVDPSYSMHRNDPGHSHGIGYWDNETETRELWDHFGLGHIITHYRMRSAEYLGIAKRDQAKIDLLYIDGDHSYAGVMFDMTSFLPYLAADSLVLAHDVDPNCHTARGFEVLESLSGDSYEYVRIPLYPGLAIMRPCGPDNQGRSFQGKPLIGGYHGD